MYANYLTRVDALGVNGALEVFLRIGAIQMYIYLLTYRRMHCHKCSSH